MRQSTGKDDLRIVEINSRHPIYSVFFAEDGKEVLSGGVEGTLRRWRVENGHEVGGAIRTGREHIFTAALSLDRRWLVCGLRPVKMNDGKARAEVWNARTRKKVLDIKTHKDTVFSVDISPDSTKFATGSADRHAFIWSMSTGRKLVGPLQHEGIVVTVRFSPNGDRVATATAANPDAKSIRIYDSNNGEQLLDIPFSVRQMASSYLAWSVDGRRLFAVSHSEVTRFDISSRTLHASTKWPVPGGGQSASIVLSRNQKFTVVVAFKTLSFWDTYTCTQIGTIIEHSSDVWSVALSPEDDRVVTGEQNGKIIVRSLRDILPDSYFTAKSLLSFTASQLPFICINDVACKLWTQGDLTRVEELLTREVIHPLDSVQYAHALANRALVRTRLGQWNTAIEDAKKSIEVQRSVAAYIAYAMAQAGNGEHALALRVFDLVFSDSLSTENNILLLIKAIILFECGMRDDAISRVDDLIGIVDDQSLYITVRAHMLLFPGSMSRQGDNERDVELLRRVQGATPIQSPYSILISLISGWDFDKLPLTIQLHLQQCIKQFEDKGDAAMQSSDPEEAIRRYSTALSLDPPNPAGLLVKRSKCRAMLGLWDDALKDANEAISVDSPSPWGYERRHAALHALQRYDEAIDTCTRMLSLIRESPDHDTRQLSNTYVSPSQSEATIDNVIRTASKTPPLVLIDVQSGRLCDIPERIRIFKSEQQFKELISSMTGGLDSGRIHQVVEEYFRYITLSHVWEGKEPSFQDVSKADSVWGLDSSALNDKLRKFCEVVRTDGYRWAWSDTCCIDKTISTVLNQSLIMMYKWYEASAATFVFLANVATPSVLGDLTKSTWMTRAWTEQELLAPKVIRFYDRNWQPYLGDARSNHKESPEIMQELANAIGVSCKTIISFNPRDLSVREKLRLASTRNATVEEDIAYSLIGIFKSDIIPRYGEEYAALGHLLEEIVARSGDVTVLAWAGRPSPYNSCLPATLAVYGQPPYASPAIGDTEMDHHIASLKNTLSQTDVISIRERVTHLPPARFATRRLHLPCIIFPVTRVDVQDIGNGQENRHRALVTGIGDVEFQTSDRLSPTEPRRFIFVHPWIHDLCDPLDGFTWGSEVAAGSAPAPQLHAASSITMDDYTRSLRFVVRLQQPFHALLLWQQSNREFKRVATEHEIVVPGISPRIDLANDFHTGVVEIL